MKRRPGKSAITVNGGCIWWGTEDKAIYDNLIFILSGESPYVICDLVGEPTSGLEQIEVYDDVIFWSFDLNAHAKCNWWKKTATAGIGEKLTIRTAGTARKIAEK